MRFVFKYLKKYKLALIINFIVASGFVFTEIGIPMFFAEGITAKFGGGSTNYILNLSFKMYLCALIGLVLLLVLAFITNKITSKIVKDMRNDLFSHIQTFSRDEYEKFNTSRLITYIVNDCYVIMQFLIMILRIGFIAPYMIAFSFLLIYKQSPKLAFMTISVVPALLIGVFIINNFTNKLAKKQHKKLDNINRNMRESLTGLRVIRAFNRQDFQNDRFNNINTDYSNLSKKLFQKMALISPLFTIIFSILMVIVVYIGTDYISKGILELGALSAFIEYVFHTLYSFLALATVLIMYPRFSTSVNRIKDVLNTKTTIKTTETPIQSRKIEGKIEFKDVSFAYADSSKEFVLSNLNFTINPGETVAFIGSTGSGKSTLVRLIPRIFNVTRGSILLDGYNIQDYDLDELRNNIGFVSQKAVLFSGTIKENLYFGNKNATDKDIEKAIEIAQAKDFINSKKNGLDELLTEGGTNLSGGQKQRLCIARALTRNVPIYIFDDSFSALDYKTDAVLRSKLKEEVKGSTFLIVAQRISTIMDADKIFVIDNGFISGVGTHKELLSNNKIYREIAQSQLSKEELEYE